MKSLILSMTAALLTLTSVAQSKFNVEVFSEDGDPFTLVLNGVRQNDTPETNVTVTDITEGNYTLKVIFQNTAYGDLKQAMPFEPGKLYRFRIKTNKKGDRKLRYFGEVALNATKPADNSVTYHSTETGRTGEVTNVNSTTNTDVSSASGTVGTSTTTTTTTTESADGRGAGTDGGSVNMNVSVNGVNMDMGVSVSGSETGGTATSSSSTMTTTTTTTTSSSSGSFDSNSDGSSSSSMSGSTSGGSMSTGSSGCTVPTDASRVDDLINAISSESFADDKMRVAKQGVANMCIKVVDVIRIGELFSFEDDRLTWAKGAYPYTYDQENYYKVNGLFDFSDSKEELDAFISNQ